MAAMRNDLGSSGRALLEERGTPMHETSTDELAHSLKRRLVPLLLSTGREWLQLPGRVV